MIRAAAASDAQALADIYNFYVRETFVTFEEVEVTAAEMERRMQEVSSSSLPWLVSVDDGNVAGYAYASKWKARSAYRFSVEVTIYVHPQKLGRGAGKALYGALFSELACRDVHAVIGGIALPNERSIALHEGFGMRKVAHFERVGFKLGRWLDVAYWQMNLRR